MNIDDLKSTWNNQSTTDTSIDINQPLLATIEVNQQMRKLESMKWRRIVESVVFFMIIVALWQYIVDDFTMSAPVISACILNVFAIIGLAGNIGQIALISKVDYAAPVKTLQQNMFEICSHNLQLTRLVLLSVPFYMTYMFLGFDVLFSIDLYQFLSDEMVMFYAVSSAAMLAGTVWFVSKLSYKNISTPWIKWTVAHIVGESLLEMAEFLNNAETA